MKTKIFMLCVSLVLFCSNMSAQWTVWDPSNFTQSIVNTSKQVVETSTTAKNMINNFKEVQKVCRQNGLETIRGVEMSCYDYDVHKKVHVVGLALNNHPYHRE